MRRAYLPVAMRCFAILLLRLTLLLAAVASPAAAQTATSNDDVNVNSRYTVESVDLTPAGDYNLSRSLRQDIQRLIGEKLNQTLIDSIRERIKRESGAWQVRQRASRGSQPDSVRVIYELRFRNRRLETDLNSLAYHSRLGWSGGFEVRPSFEGNTLGFGMVNEGLNHVERVAGLNALYERRNLFTPYLGLRFDFQSYRAQWDRTTLEALGQEGIEGGRGGPGIYRERMNFQPSLTVRLLDGDLTFTTGASFQRIQDQFPAASIQAANAVTQSLRYRHRWSGNRDSHILDAGYDLRAATRNLDSDYVFNSHRMSLYYRLSLDRHRLIARMDAGRIGGIAPFYERYVIGNTEMLRGWSKFDLTPRGASRLAHGSLEYRFRPFAIFYDVGNAWNPGEETKVRHSAGVGIYENGFFLTVAFPIKEGSATPVFMTGVRF